ncbi:TPA: AAA family ATPase, partial [Proteus mirabilis]|nr:AAA family ATPase [Proteus mirabilis]
LKDINLGCGNYKLLLDKKIPGIYDESIIVFDGDVTNIKKYNNVIKLPTNLPPDQLLFEFLYNLPREDSFWDNDYGYHKDFFIEKADEVLYLINTNDHTIELSKLIKNFRQIPGKKPRDVFKDFAKEEVLQKLVNKGGVKYNPYRLWVDKNKLQAELFEEEFIDCLSRVLSIKYNVEQAEIKKVILKN